MIVSTKFHSSTYNSVEIFYFEPKWPFDQPTNRLIDYKTDTDMKSHSWQDS